MLLPLALGFFEFLAFVFKQKANSQQPTVKAEFFGIF